MVRLQIQIQGTHYRKTIKVSRVPIRNEHLLIDGEMYQVGDVCQSDYSNRVCMEHDLLAHVYVVRMNAGSNPF